MWSYHQQGKITLEKIVDKMAHGVADIFQIRERGYIREGYWADLVIVDPNRNTRVEKKDLLYKCGWSPLEGTTFPAAITHSFVNGHLAYANGHILASQNGQRLQFER
jgi:dihydroorotase